MIEYRKRYVWLFNAYEMWDYQYRYTYKPEVTCPYCKIWRGVKFKVKLKELPLSYNKNNLMIVDCMKQEDKIYPCEHISQVKYENHCIIK